VLIPITSRPVEQRPPELPIDLRRGLNQIAVRAGLPCPRGAEASDWWLTHADADRHFPSHRQAIGIADRQCPLTRARETRRSRDGHPFAGIFRTARSLRIRKNDDCGIDFSGVGGDPELLGLATTCSLVTM